MTAPLVDGCIELMEDALPGAARQPRLHRGHDRSRGGRLPAHARARHRPARQQARRRSRTAPRSPGDVAFDLYETYGFPLEVTEEIAAEREIDVDIDGYEAALRRAQEISGGKASKEALYADLSDFQSVLDRFGPTDFVGREEFETKATVLAVVPGRDGEVAIVLDRTPFYAEAGGQVGDTGTITTDTGTAEVLDTNYALPGCTAMSLASSTVRSHPARRRPAAIDVPRRDAIRRNHTGTHILHWALRQVLGDHVKQQGSLVAPDRLRFDFSHYRPAHARADPGDRGSRQQRDPRQRSRASLRDDEDERRDNSAPSRSSATSTATSCACSRPVAIRSSCAAARTSARSATSARSRSCGKSRSARTCAASRPSPAPARSSASAVRNTWSTRSRSSSTFHVRTWSTGSASELDEIKGLRDESKTLRRQAATGRSAELAAGAVDGVVVAKVDGVDRDGLRDLAVAVRDVAGIRAVVLGAAPEGGGAALVSAVTDDSGLHAGKLIADAAKAIKGGGGSDPSSPVAGGKDPGLDDALALARGRSRWVCVRALGLDLGSKRIGVAVSDDQGRVATPIETINRARAGRAVDHGAVSGLVDEWGCRCRGRRPPVVARRDRRACGASRARRGRRASGRPRGAGRDDRRTLHHGHGRPAVASAGRARQEPHGGHRPCRSRGPAAVMARSPAARR